MNGVFRRRAPLARGGIVLACLVSGVLAAPIAQSASPTISGSPTTSTTVGKAYSFQPTARDADGNRLTFSIASKPPWASFNSSTGKLSGTPAVVHARAWSNIVISVSDGSSKKSLPSFAILVRPLAAASNAAPKISGAPPKTAQTDITYRFSPSSSDVNNDKLTFSISNKPSWAQFDTQTGKLTGIPRAQHVGVTSPITIKVSDGKNTTALFPFQIMVKTASASNGGSGADGRVTVSWYPPTHKTDGSSLNNLAGYRIRYGRNASDLSKVAQIANPGIVRYLLDDLSPGTWFVAITAYTSGGIESDLSEIAKTTIQ